jgi:hypothetical protein
MTTQTSASIQERPAGITLLAILQLIAGLLGLCIPTILLLGGTALTLVGGGIVGGLGIVVALLMFIAPALHLLVAFGALNLRPWAWWLGVIATGLDVFGVIINLWNGAGAIAALFPAFFSVLVFIYLMTPNVRKAFKI